MLPKTHRKVFSRFKTSVEHYSGLTLGDALNLSLFGLTMVSLVFAAAGLVIAMVMYRDAVRSGEIQQVQMKNAAESLSDATSTLNASKAELDTMTRSIAENIRIAQQQQKNLERSVQLSSAQLDALHTQNAIASRAPLGRLGVMCDSNPISASSLDDEITILRPAAIRQAVQSIAVTLDKDGELFCGIKLLNEGKAKLTDAYIEAQAWAVLDGNDEWAFSGRSEAPKYRVYKDYDETAIQKEWMERNNARGRISLLKDVVVFPDSAAVGLARFGTPRALLELQIPGFAKHVELKFWYGGADQQEAIADVDLPIKSRR